MKTSSCIYRPCAARAAEGRKLASTVGTRRRFPEGLQSRPDRSPLWRRSQNCQTNQCSSEPNEALLGRIFHSPGAQSRDHLQRPSESGIV